MSQNPYQDAFDDGFREAVDAGFREAVDAGFREAVDEIVQFVEAYKKGQFDHCAVIINRFLEHTNCPPVFEKDFTTREP